MQCECHDERMLSVFKPVTIQTKLFISYSSFILCILLLFIISFYLYIAETLETRASESLYQLSGYISSQADAELKSMNSLSQKIIFSQPLLSTFYSDIYTLSSDSIYGQRKFNELTYSITGPQFPVYQINMYRTNGNFASIGFKTDFTKLSGSEIKSIPWWGDVMRLNGTRYITVPRKDGFGASNRPVISLCRSFAESYGQTPDSIIEIQQDYKKFENLITNALGSSGHQKVYILDSGGAVIYPPDGAADDNMVRMYLDTIKQNGSANDMSKVNRPETENKQIFAYTRSEFSGWIVIVSELESDMLAPVQKFRNNILLGSIAILIITLVISYFVSRGLSTPIRKLHRTIKGLSLHSLPEKALSHTNTGIIELEDLNLSFEEMCRKLKSSLEETVLSRSHEMYARLLALQSQMNPHFLYNIITVISIMAEEDDSPRIVKSCRDLSNMLRYITSDYTLSVTLREELEHTLNFLNLMKVRYGSDLNFSVNIPESMMDIRLPKLVVQPLVENCTKYAFHVDPPWNIEINGRQDAAGWEISIGDNGEGFDEAWMKSALERLSSLKHGNNALGLKIDGMGLVNIYARLGLIYGENSIFKLQNKADGGAMVTIGALHSSR